jgi:hypothetical protein
MTEFRWFAPDARSAAQLVPPLTSGAADVPTSSPSPPTATSSAVAFAPTRDAWGCRRCRSASHALRAARSLARGKGPPSPVVSALAPERPWRALFPERMLRT